MNLRNTSQEYEKNDNYLPEAISLTTLHITYFKSNKEVLYPAKMPVPFSTFE